MTSTNTMIERLSGCLGTGDLSSWEEGFVRSLIERKNSGQVTQLSERQVEALAAMRTMLAEIREREAEEARAHAEREAQAKRDAASAAERAEAERQAREAQEAEVARLAAKRAEIERQQAEIERQAAELRARQEEAARSAEAAAAADAECAADPIPGPAPVAATPVAVPPAPTTTGTPSRPSRPSDDQIIEALSMHYRVHETTVISWLLDMDLDAASARAAANL